MRKLPPKMIPFVTIGSLSVLFAGAMLLITFLPKAVAFAAIDDAATTTEDTSATVSVLANDTDEDKANLLISTYTQPEHGYVIKYGTGLRYTPYADYHGTDSFTYTITNAASETATATVTVTITPVNDTPIAHDDTASTTTDVGITIDVTDNDSEPDGDVLTIDSYTHPDHGTVTITEDNQILYVPDAGYVGDDEFTYLVVDPDGLSDRATVTVHVTAGD